MIVFYSFSIIGMEVFTGKNNTVFPGCWSVNNMKACMPFTIVSFIVKVQPLVLVSIMRIMALYEIIHTCTG